MIKKISRLLRIKEIKEEEALRALQAKRRELSNAELDKVKAEEAVAESKRTYEAREDAIYQQILGATIKQNAIDDTKAKVVALAGEHQALIDDVTRMIHVIERLKGEVRQAVEHHARCVRIKDKYVHLRSKMLEQKLMEETAREDGEIEELFAKPIRKVA
jgi:hypothetical protein